MLRIGYDDIFKNNTTDKMKETTTHEVAKVPACFSESHRPYQRYPKNPINGRSRAMTGRLYKISGLKILIFYV